MPTLTAIHEWALAASLRASLLSIVVLLIQAVLRRHISARMRYALWLPVLVVLILPTLPESRWSIESAIQSNTVEMPTGPAVVAPPIKMKASLPAMMKPAAASIDWQRFMILAWFAGAAGLLITGGISFLVTLHRYRKCRQPASAELMTTLAQLAQEVGLRRMPLVCVSPAVRSPAVTGLLRPMLLLPADFDREFTPSEARLVLTHELMHLKRGDLALNAVICLLMALHWFNPLLWFAFFRVRMDREAACDAQVLDDASNARRLEYGHALLKVETAFCPHGLSLGFVGIFQRGAALRARIHSIALNPKPHALMKVIITGCIFTLTFLGITRAETKATPKDTTESFGVELKIVHFDKATDWTVNEKLFKARTEKSDDLWSSDTLSPTDTSELLAEIAKQPAAKFTSYPRMLAPSGKEMVVRSVVNQPIDDGKGQVTYLPIGLVVKLTTRRVGDEKLALKIDLTDSNIVTQEPLTATSRVFNTTVEITPGQSFHLVGWEDGKPKTKRPVIYIVTPIVIEPTTSSSQAEELDPLYRAPKALLTELQGARAQQYDFAKANLGDVLRFLATDARLSFISLPEDNPITKKLVTFSVNGSPFSVLDSMCRANGLALRYEETRWYIRPAEDQTLIGKSYPWLKKSVTVETITNDIESILDVKNASAQGQAKAGNKKSPEPGVKFDDDKNSFYITATQIQHTWVSAYFKGMGR